MAQIKLTVLVHDHCRDRYSTIVDDCRRAGLAVESELVSIGAIIGCIEEDRVAILTRIDGVSAVEPERKLKGI